MKILEKILTIIILIALVMKFALIAGSDSVLLLALMTLASIYFPLGFLFFNQVRLRDIFKNSSSLKDVTASGTIFAIAAGLGLSTVVVGALFKLLNFPGANPMLLVGLSVTAVVLIIAIVLFVKNNDVNSKFILWRAGVNWSYWSCAVAHFRSDHR